MRKTSCPERRFLGFLISDSHDWEYLGQNQMNPYGQFEAKYNEYRCRICGEYKSVQGA